jgi:cell wall-associated NlpC family hydrolase
MKNIATALRFTIITALLIVASTASAQTAQQVAAMRQQQWAAYQQQVAVYQQQVAVYNQQMAAYKAQQVAVARPVAPAARAAAPASGNSLIRFDGRQAACSASLPTQVQYLINAANHLQSSPYVRGAGHGRVEDRAYDCSSSTSYTLIKAGLLKAPLTSIGFASYGQAGEGRFITIWVKPGEHVFMTICGLRLDTSGGKVGEGPRWRTKGRSYAGFSPRHPFGL